MTEYKISLTGHTCSYSCNTDIIYIGTGNLDMLTDSETDEYISDGLIHEHIHKELFILFDNNVSKLFDAIEYLFRNVELSEKAMPSNRETYQTYISRKGFKKFLEYYNLNKYDVVDANKLCNFRRKNDKLPK